MCRWAPNDVCVRSISILHIGPDHPDPRPSHKANRSPNTNTHPSGASRSACAVLPAVHMIHRSLYILGVINFTCTSEKPCMYTVRVYVWCRRCRVRVVLVAGCIYTIHALPAPYMHYQHHTYYTSTIHTLPAPYMRHQHHAYCGPKPDG